RGVSNGAARHAAAVAQHRVTIGDPRYFLEEMRDVQDRQAGGGELANDAKQALRVLCREAARRLVEDEHTAFRLSERTRDGDELRAARRQIAGERFRRQ